MNRIAESELLDFCARQHESFHADAWQKFDRVSPLEMATVALFLAGASWYGHRQSLVSLAERLVPDSNGHFAQLAKQASFDCNRFSGLLKARLRHEQAVSRAH